MLAGIRGDPSEPVDFLPSLSLLEKVLQVKEICFCCNQFFREHGDAQLV